MMIGTRGVHRVTAGRRLRQGRQYPRRLEAPSMTSHPGTPQDTSAPRAVGPAEPTAQPTALPRWSPGARTCTIHGGNRWCRTCDVYGHLAARRSVAGDRVSAGAGLAPTNGPRVNVSSVVRAAWGSPDRTDRFSARGNQRRIASFPVEVAHETSTTVARKRCDCVRAWLAAGIQIALYAFDRFDDGVADARSGMIGLAFVAVGVGVIAFLFRSREQGPPDA